MEILKVVIALLTAVIGLWTGLWKYFQHRVHEDFDRIVLGEFSQIKDLNLPAETRKKLDERAGRALIKKLINKRYPIDFRCFIPLIFFPSMLICLIIFITHLFWFQSVFSLILIILTGLFVISGAMITPRFEAIQTRRKLALGFFDSEINRITPRGYRLYFENWRSNTYYLIKRSGNLRNLIWCCISRKKIDYNTREFLPPLHAIIYLAMQRSGISNLQSISIDELKEDGISPEKFRYFCGLLSIEQVNEIIEESRWMNLRRDRR